MAEVQTSIIIPIYNSEAYLALCVESALCQSTDPKEYEILLIDDGSDDGSLNIACGYAAKNSNVRVITGTHRRQGHARNTGINEAKGRYILFLDSDDMLSRDAVSTCTQLADTNRLDMLTFDAESVDENGRKVSPGADYFPRSGIVPEEKLMTGKEYWTRYHDAGGIYYSAPLHYVRRGFLVDNALFFETDIYFEDNDWVLRAYAAAGSVMYAGKPLYVRRYHQGQTIESTRGYECVASCLKIHSVLRKLLRERSDDMCFRDMVFSVSDLNAARIRKEKIPGADRVDELIKETHAATEYICEDADLFDMDFIILSEMTDLFCRSGSEKGRKAINRLRSDLQERHYMLGDNKNRVGIYGTGKISRRFIEWYLNTAGDICAELEFFETEPSKTDFMGYPVKSAAELERRHFDNMITAVRSDTAAVISEGIKEILGVDQKITPVHALLFDNKMSYHRQNIREHQSYGC